MGACSSECPVVQTLRELEIGESELCEVGLLTDRNIRIATVGLCRALLEEGVCESGPVTHADPDGNDFAWIACGNSNDIELSRLCDVVGAHSDSYELNIRRESGTNRAAEALKNAGHEKRDTL
jgi:hypothetical protein